MLRPIVLLTDFGATDAYVGLMKGVIQNLTPGACIVDLCHGIEPQNVLQAALVLESSYSYFPKESIFVCVVDPGVGSERRLLAAKTKSGIFLGPDNGLLSPVLAREKQCELRTATHRSFFLKKVSRTFHGRDCFAPTAARLAREPERFSQLGPRTRRWNRLRIPMPRVTPKRVEGEILFFDHFGNAFTSITGGDLKELSGGRKFKVEVGGRNLGRIRRSYFEAEVGQLVAVISSSDRVEIAVNQGSAQRTLRLKKGDAVYLE